MRKRCVNKYKLNSIISDIAKKKGIELPKDYLVDIKNMDKHVETWNSLKPKQVSRNLLQNMQDQINKSPNKEVYEDMADQASFVLLKNLISNTEELFAFQKLR